MLVDNKWKGNLHINEQLTMHISLTPKLFLRYSLLRYSIEFSIKLYHA
jgi:hypothetical protein